MRFLLAVPLVVVLAFAYPHSIEENDKTVITEDYYPENLVIYEGEHEIVDIMVPLNRASMYESIDSSTSSELSELKDHLMVFFVEADFKNGYREDYGIYMYRNGKVTKIMDKGRAITASADDSEYVFFGANDGLYVYNPETLKADKYGKFNDSVKDIAKEHYTDAIYVLTDDHELYKVYDVGTEIAKIDDVKGAEQIMMDYSNNLYFYDKNKSLYVRNANGDINMINDIPEEVNEMKLFRPPFFITEGVGLMIDTEMYTVYADGKTEPENLEFMPEAVPTAYTSEAGILRYFGYKNKIYEYDLLSMIDSSESASDFKSNYNNIILRR